jgi:hypothetical protein
LTSNDGEIWESAALLTSPVADLRDPKLSLTPTGRLMCLAGGAMHNPVPVHHQSYVWLSGDGTSWGHPLEVGDPNVWLWRVTWHHGVAYGVGYAKGEFETYTRLYRSGDGHHFETHVPTLFDRGYPNESTLCFLPDDRALCLLRRDGERDTAQLGTAEEPYVDWSWQDLGIRIGGPDLIRLPDGRLLAAARFYKPEPHTALAWLDADAGALSPCLRLPSGGDTSYPGLVWHEDRLWLSYYASHEENTAIYVAQIAFD